MNNTLLHVFLIYIDNIKKKLVENKQMLCFIQAIYIFEAVCRSCNWKTFEDFLKLLIINSFINRILNSVRICHTSSIYWFDSVETTTTESTYLFNSSLSVSIMKIANVNIIQVSFFKQCNTIIYKNYSRQTHFNPTWTGIKQIMGKLAFQMNELRLVYGVFHNS